MSQEGFGSRVEALVPNATRRPAGPLTLAGTESPSFSPDVPIFHLKGGLAPGGKGGMKAAILTPPGDRSSRTPFCSLRTKGEPLQEDA